jgi:TonB family protein
VVALEIVVLGTGEVDSVRVLKATPAGFFEDAAITGFKNAKFSPGILGGLGVKSRMEIEVEFMPTNRGGGVAGQR